MEQVKIDLIIDKKIADAKLEVVEKRFQITIWSVGILLTMLAALFGMIIPMVTASRNTDKVDNEVRRMQDEVKEMRRSLENVKAKNDTNFGKLKTEVTARTTVATQEMKTEVREYVGKQLTKPEIVCRFLGKEIAGEKINITGVDNWFSKLELYNKETVTAKNVKVVIYVKENSKLKILDDNTKDWSIRGGSEEPGFSRSFIYNKKIETIYAKDFTPLTGVFYYGETNIEDEILMKLYYDIPEPTRIKFSIVISEKK